MNHPLRSLLLSCLLFPTLALADNAPPRLADLAPPLSADTADERRMTPIGQYAETRIMQLQLKAGTEIPSHSAPARVVVIVLDGRGHFDFNGEIIPLHARQVLHMEPGEAHGVVAETDLDLLVVRLPE